MKPEGTNCTGVILIHGPSLIGGDVSNASIVDTKNKNGVDLRPHSPQSGRGLISVLGFTGF